MKYINNNPRRPYITAELKDRLLDLLVNNLQIRIGYTLNISPIQNAMGGIDVDIIDGMFALFDDDRLIDYRGYNHAIFDLTMLPRAVEFYGKGGYTARDLLVEKQIRLIEAQLRDLQSHSADKITSILEALNHLRQLFSVFFGA